MKLSTQILVYDRNDKTWMSWGHIEETELGEALKNAQVFRKRLFKVVIVDRNTLPFKNSVKWFNPPEYPQPQ